MQLWEIILGLITIPIMMILFGALFVKRPPRSINWVYGYRTFRAMKSLEAWLFAHKYFGTMWLKFGILMLIVSLVLVGLSQSGNAIDADTILSIWIPIQLVLLLVPIVPTELALRRSFDKDGKPSGQ